ncbi:MAG: Uncharacterised protein [Glaciecola sp. HTCC2999]|nr:MAG: Uncharacterised protein [Glaciecola sp. HTCC2999]
MFKSNKKIGFRGVFLLVVLLTVTAALNASANAAMLF